MKRATLAALSATLAITFVWTLGAANAEPAPAAKAGDASLVGVWRLVRYVDRPDGADPVYAFGKQPIGQFIFTADGHISVNIMRNPPAPGAASADIDPDACMPDWYCSYFGTYTVAADRGQWTTQIEGGNIAAYLGTRQSRTFQIVGGRLTIAETYQEAGRTVRAERVLQRVGP